MIFIKMNINKIKQKQKKLTIVNFFTNLTY